MAARPDNSAGDLTKFYSLDTFSTAINRSEFDDLELVETIISHIRDPDPQVSLKGINTFQKERDARARAHGLLQSTSATITKETPDGTASLTFSGQSLAARLSHELSRTRPASLHTAVAPLDPEAEIKALPCDTTPGPQGTADPLPRAGDVGGEPSLPLPSPLPRSERSPCDGDPTRP